MEKNLQIWEKTFGQEESAFDFTGQLILKKEFKTNSPFSWELDSYDYEDDEQFICSSKAIKIRDKKSVFVVDKTQYLVVKNPNYTYSIISDEKILDNNLIINYDLFLNNQLQKQTSDSQMITISFQYQKINPIFEKVCVSYLEGVIKSYFDVDLLFLDNKENIKNKIIFTVNIENNLLKKLFSHLLKIQELIKLFYLRMNQKFGDALLLDIPCIDNKFVYNIFVYSNEAMNVDLNDNENNFLKKVQCLENKIILNSHMFSIMEESGFDVENFNKYLSYEKEDIYSYDFIDINFNTYLDKLKK